MIVGVLKEIKIMEKRVCMTPVGVTAPLLVPMSEVAGRMATQEAAKYLEMPQGGHGGSSWWRYRC